MHARYRSVGLAINSRRRISPGRRSGASVAGRRGEPRLVAFTPRSRHSRGVRLPNFRLLFRKRLALPQLRRPVSKPGDPRIFGFNAERDLVISEVVGRVLSELGADKQRLMLTLNETGHHEVRRLEAQRDEETAAHLSRWHRTLRRLTSMEDDDLRGALREVIDRMARDVAGNFDPRVYDFALKLVRPTVVAAMSPSSAMAGSQGRVTLDRILQCEGAVDVVHALAKEGTVIFVPTHSSNLDSLAVGEQLARRGLPPAVYGAGKNLFSNPIVSFFMHNLGAYRVDRRVKANLYKRVLKAYACVLLERGYHMLFFPGGTRSRSGLVEQKLKLGLAGTAAEAYARSLMRGRGRRIFFVPITINYEIVLEAETLIEDFLKEQGKTRYIIEDDEFSQIDRWISFFRQLRDHDAGCVLRFGQPIDPFGNVVNAKGESLAPDGRVIDPADYVTRGGAPVLDSARDAAYTRELGKRLTEAYERDTVVMATQLVAHVLYRRLVMETPELDFFARMRVRDEVEIPERALLEEIDACRDALLALEAAGKVVVGAGIRDADARAILGRAQAAWNYHQKSMVRKSAGAYVIGDPPLLLFYQHRVVAHAPELATNEAQREVAFELMRVRRAVA